MKQAVLFCVLIGILPGAGYSTPATKTPILSEQEPQTDNKVSSPIDSFKNIPASSLIKIMAAEMAISRSHPEVAVQNYIAAAQETQDAKVAKRATQVALTFNQSVEVALTPALIWAKAAPNDLESQITISALYIRLGQIKETTPYLHQVAIIDKENAYEDYLLLYQQLSQGDDPQNVISSLERLGQKYPKLSAPYLALAQIHLSTGNFDATLALTHKLTKLAPNETNVIILHTKALTLSKKVDGAKKYIKERIDNHPKDFKLRHFYAQFLFEQGASELAKQELARFKENPDLGPEELLHLSRLAMQAHWFEECEFFLLKASKFDEHRHTASYFLARLKEMQDDKPAAIKWYQQVKSGTFHIISYLRAVTLLQEEHRYKESLALLEKTTPENSSDYKRVILSKVEMMIYLKKNNDALMLLNYELNHFDNDIDLLYSRSLVYQNMNRLKEAEVDLQLVLEMYPEHIDALNAIGYILISNESRHEEAMAYIEKAIKLAPNNPSIMDSMGWLLFKMGELNQAQQWLEKAMSLMPDPEIAAHLGEVLWHLDLHDEARATWEGALKGNPEHELLHKIMKRYVGVAGKSK